MDERSRQLAEGLQSVRTRIDEACRVAGRDPHSVTLIVVTKTWPSSDIDILAGLGVGDVGENRVDELRRKTSDIPQTPLRWHFIGQIQTKKAGHVAAVADVVHSVDRLRLAESLQRAAQRHDRVLDVFIQVSLDQLGVDQTLDTARASPESPAVPHERGGADPSDLMPLADAVAASPNLRLVGVMCLPPQEMDADVAFARLQQVSLELQQSHPEARSISAGMSHDLESALSHGATHVRIGTAILGTRSTVR